MIKHTMILIAATIAMSDVGAIAKPGKDNLTTLIASTASLTNVESTKLLNGLAPSREIASRLKKIKASIQALQNPRATKQSQVASLKRGHTETLALDQTLVKLRKGFDAVEQRLGSTGGQASVDANRAALDALRLRFESATKDAESDDNLAQFEIQDLMYLYNQAETTASTVKKKVDDTKNSIVQNVAG